MQNKVFLRDTSLIKSLCHAGYIKMEKTEEECHPVWCTCHLYYSPGNPDQWQSAQLEATTETKAPIWHSRLINLISVLSREGAWSDPIDIKRGQPYIFDLYFAIMSSFEADYAYPYPQKIFIIILTATLSSLFSIFSIDFSVTEWVKLLCQFWLKQAAASRDCSHTVFILYSAHSELSQCRAVIPPGRAVIFMAQDIQSVAVNINNFFLQLDTVSYNSDLVSHWCTAWSSFRETTRRFCGLIHCLPDRLHPSNLYNIVLLCRK